MTQLQLLRLWARRAPVSERLSAGVGAALALALFSWLVAPPDHHTVLAGAATGQNGTSAAGAGQAAGSAIQGAGLGSGGSSSASSAVPAGTGLAGGGALSGGTGAGGGVAGSGATSGVGATGCVGPPGTDQGVTAGGIKVAMIVLNISGQFGNSAFNVPPPAHQESDYQAAVDYVNSHGGVACRKILPIYYQANVLDSASLQQLCLQIAQDKPFFLFEGGGYAFTYPSLLSCFAQNHIPWLSPAFVTAQQVNQWYPYGIFEMQSDRNYHTTISALAQRGWFNAANGFKELGFAYQSCDSQIPSEFVTWLHQAGVPSSQITTFDLGCSNVFTSPSVLEEAILQFKQLNVTNVMFAYDNADFEEWTKLAEQQQFKPLYGISDVNEVGNTYSNSPPDPNNLSNALAIDDTAFGEEHTPGMQPSPATQKCLGIYGAKVAYPVTDYNLMIQMEEWGSDCWATWVFQAMVNHAPALQRNALAAGLQSAKSVDMPYPYAPVDWSAPRTAWGGQYWRVNEFFSSCGCWRLVDQTWHPQL